MKDRLKRILNSFTLYEKIWFLSTIVLTIIITILFPSTVDNLEINPALIMMLYVMDVLFNVLCELLISKQSKWNFIVSLFVEATEIAICLVIRERFATMATTILFWIPIDIISFVNWNRHLDKENDSLTVVRSLKGYQEVLIILGIIVWTVVVGGILARIDADGILESGSKLEIALCYIDALTSAVAVCNGVFILLRLKEQWIAWYISSALETVMNIILGQWVLLVLKAAYFTNTTYGYIKWSKYINNKKYKMIAVDLDGTLLTHDKKIPQDALDKINEIVKTDKIFAISTGRSYFGVSEYINKIDADIPLILYNGGIVRFSKTDKVLLSNHLTSKKAHEIIDIIDKEDGTFIYWSDDVLFSTKNNQRVKDYSTLSKLEAKIVSNDEIDYDKINKIIWIDKNEKLVKYQNTILKDLKEINYFLSTEEFLEFVSSSVSKENALKVLLDYYNIEKEELIAVGDSFNDLSMICFAGLGVAMGNAFDEVKKKADLVTETNEDGGVLEILRKYF
mgnify:CR=1 FL=1